MGGDYYDRAVTSTDSTYSAAATSVLTQNGLHPDLNPFQRPVTCAANQVPIVVAIDVTGSMSNWPKILWDKMPMFFGQIMMKNYITNPVISFCATGDANGDRAPLQVCQFAQGNELDQWISKIFLEGGGAGTKNAHETYELAAFYYANLFSWEGEPEPEPGGPYTGRKGYFFLAADEFFYETLNGSQVRSIILGEEPPSIDSREVFKKLQEKFHIFLVKKSYGHNVEEKIIQQWSEAIGRNNILPLSDPKAIVDVMLGVLAVHSKKLANLDEYIADMVDRGQTEERIKVIRQSLKSLHY